jgi:hypothetical protein
MHKAVPEERPAKFAPALFNIVLHNFRPDIFAKLVNVREATGRAMRKNCVGGILVLIGAMLVVAYEKNINFQKA